MEILENYIEIAPRFRRSVHLESDFARENALDGYVVSPLARDLALRIVEGAAAPNGTKAWSLVGPYGSGKSAFLTFIGHMLQGDSEALSLFNGYWPDESQHSEHLSSLGGLVPLLVTGEQVPIATAVLRAAHKTALDYWSGPGKTPSIVEELAELANKAASGSRVSDSQVVESLIQLGEQIKSSSRDGNGLCVIIDEMGKFLEFAAMRGENGDIYMLQLLAEAAARSSKTPFVLITTLHQGLDSYAEGLPRSKRLEWSKVAGRYETMPFLETPRYLTKLIRGAIEWRGDQGLDVRKTTQKLADQLVKSNERLADFDREDLRECAPLHPITALCLGPLFRTQFGQNERSLFAFLTSREPHGFQSYLRTSPATTATPYPLDEIYDYILANTGARVVGVSWDRSWTAAQQALSRLPSDSSPLDMRIIKCIAVLSLVGVNVGLRADHATLAIACEVTESEIKASLERLEKLSAVVFRQFKNAYHVWDGSDLNIPDLIAERRRKVKAQGGFAERLQKLLPPVPVIATRHYHQTGTLRHLMPTYSSVPAGTNQWVRKDDGDGDLLYIIPDQLEDLESAKVLIGQRMQYVGESLRPLIIALPRAPELLLERVVDYFALEDAIANTPELTNDPVGRRELHDRLLGAMDSLTDAIERSFTSSSEDLLWFWKGELMLGEKRVSACASRIFDEAYTEAPVLKNELINRDVLSSHASGARRVLMELMMDRENTERLGLEGYPPELSVYRSLFESQGLHCKGADGLWHIVEPDGSSSFASLWKHLDRFFESSGGQRFNFLTLMKELAKPPYGIREGVAPILLLAYFLTRREEVFVYEDNSFLPSPASDLVARLLKRPGTFELQWSALADVSNPLVEKLYDKLQLAGTPSVLNVVRKLVRFVAGLSPYANKTQSVSQDAAAVRNAIKAARDPMKLLTIGLPEALGYVVDELRKDPKQIESFADRITSAVLELQALDDDLKKLIADRLERHLSGGHGPEFYQLLQKRAEGMVEKEFVPMRVRNFVNVTAASAAQDDTYYMAAGTAILGKPPTSWTDDDVRHFEYRALDLARDFLASEIVLSKSGGSSEGDKVIRVSVVYGDKEQHGLATTKANDAQVSEMLGLVSDHAEKLGLRKRDAAFAVIAGMLEILNDDYALEVQ